MNPTEDADRRHAAERHLASLDDDWARLIVTVGPCGLAPGPQSEPWQALVRTVAWQQLHGRAAEAIFGRFLALHGGDFPSPGRLLATDPAALRGCGFSARKVDTIRSIAEAVQDGIVPARDDALAMDDDELAARLPGVDLGAVIQGALDGRFPGGATPGQDGERVGAGCSRANGLHLKNGKARNDSMASQHLHSSCADRRNDRVRFRMPDHRSGG